MQPTVQPNLQPSDQPRRRRGPGKPFRPGKSGNPLGSRLMIEKRAAMQAEIKAELGGQLSATDEMMLQRAVELLTRRPQNHNEAVRLINAGSRILGQLRAKYALKDAQARHEILAGREEPDDARTSETERESQTDLWVSEGDGPLRNSSSGETLSENEFKSRYPDAQTIRLNVFGDRPDKKMARKHGPASTGRG